MREVIIWKLSAVLIFVVVSSLQCSWRNPEFFFGSISHNILFFQKISHKDRSSNLYRWWFLLFSALGEMIRTWSNLTNSDLRNSLRSWNTWGGDHNFTPSQPKGIAPSWVNNASNYIIQHPIFSKHLTRMTGYI